MKLPFLGANIKMNELPAGWNELSSPYRPRPHVEVVLFPSFLDLATCATGSFLTGAQCGVAKGDKPRTGDLSMDMLASRGCRYVLCGHSEQRLNHCLTDAMVKDQANAALTAGMFPVVCIGETAEERAAGKTKDTVRIQLSVIAKDPRIIIAYEPRWAISGGRTSGESAKPEDAEAVHAFIREFLGTDDIRIIYGGSMDGKNCESLLKCPHIDGGLIGGAALRIKEFGQIVETAATVFANE